MKILFIGDIVGKPGREITRRALPLLIDRHGIDLTIANVENAAGGMGVTRDVAESLRDAGVQVMTSGNHIWDKREALDYIEVEPRLLAPGQLSGWRSRPGTLRRRDRRRGVGGGAQHHGPESS